MHALLIGQCAFILTLAVSVLPGHAQSAGCLLLDVGSTGRQVVRCGNDIRISVERGAEYSLHDRNGDGLVDQVRLRSRALLLVIQGEVAHWFPGEKIGNGRWLGGRFGFVSCDCFGLGGGNGRGRGCR